MSTSLLLAPGETIVITCHVPTETAEGLHVARTGRTVTVTGPNGFRHDLYLPPDASTHDLHWEVFKGIFELRAPSVG